MNREDDFEDDEEGDLEEDGFNEAEMEEHLEALYRPDCYAEGEQLCLELLEDVAPDWEPARLFLLLFLAAQDAEEEALHMVDELDDESLFRALRHLAFGADTETEDLIYSDIIACAKSRGLDQQLEDFFSTFEKPMARQDVSANLSSWE